MLKTDQAYAHAGTPSPTNARTSVSRSRVRLNLLLCSPVLAESLCSAAAPAAGGDIEDLVPAHDEDEQEAPDPAAIVMCPFHAYDWNLTDGSSSTGMKACTYAVHRNDEGELWLEPPGDPGDDYRVTGIRAVSEREPLSCSKAKFRRPVLTSRPRPKGFATPAEQVPDLSSLALSEIGDETEPKTIVSFCRAVLLARSPSHKVALVRRLVSLFRSGSLTRLSDPKNDPPHPSEPYRAPTTKTVASGQTRSLGKGGSVQTRIRMLHALANIELWAIDLAVDHIARFYDWRLGTRDGQGAGKRIGWGFVADFLRVAEDEAKHFTLLSERLEALGCTYGELSVHNGRLLSAARPFVLRAHPPFQPPGLWESALQTSHSLFSRLAIIALVHEARGLDSNPMQIRRCRTSGDEETARVLEIIHADEITHVAAGSSLVSGRVCDPRSPLWHGDRSPPLHRPLRCARAGSARSSRPVPGRSRRALLGSRQGSFQRRRPRQGGDWSGLVRESGREGYAESGGGGGRVLTIATSCIP